MFVVDGAAHARRTACRQRGQVTGYVVGLARHTAIEGGIVWYGGGKLAAGLTLPRLRRHWNKPGTEHGMHLGPGVPAGAARAVLRNMVTVAAQTGTG